MQKYYKIFDKRQGFMAYVRSGNSINHHKQEKMVLKFTDVEFMNSNPVHWSVNIAYCILIDIFQKSRNNILNTFWKCLCSSVLPENEQ